MGGGSGKGLGAERRGPRKRDPSVKTQNGACVQNRGHTKKRPFRVSRRARSTALWVARRSAVLARLLGLRLAAAGAA